MVAVRSLKVSRAYSSPSPAYWALAAVGAQTARLDTPRICFDSIYGLAVL